MQKITVIKVVLAALLVVSIAIGSIAVLNHFNKFSFEYLSAAEFGGDELVSWGFDAPVEFTGSGVYVAENFKLVPKNWSYNSDNGQFELSVKNSDSVSSQDPHLIWGYNTNLRFSDFSYYMIDFDISVETECLNRFIYLHPNFRDDNYVAKQANSGVLYIGEGYKIIKNDQCLYEPDSPEFHFTYLFDNAGRALVYVDGNYVCELNNVYASTATMIDGVKVSIEVVEQGATLYSFDNVEIHTFAPEYDGAINEVFEEPERSLTKCSDSVLFERKW